MLKLNNLFGIIYLVKKGFYKKEFVNINKNVAYFIKNIIKLWVFIYLNIKKQ